MKAITTSKGDYDGCAPVVKEAILSGKSIKCYVAKDKTQWEDIIGYSRVGYFSTSLLRYSYVEPVIGDIYLKSEYEVVMNLYNNNFSFQKIESATGNRPYIKISSKEHKGKKYFITCDRFSKVVNDVYDEEILEFIAEVKQC